MMQNSSTQTRMHNVCIATSAKECNKKVCNLTAEVRGKGQDRSLMDGFISLNQFKILLDSGAQTSMVVAADLVTDCCSLDAHIQASGEEGI